MLGRANDHGHDPRTRSLAARRDEAFHLADCMEDDLACSQLCPHRRGVDHDIIEDNRLALGLHSGMRDCAKRAEGAANGGFPRDVGLPDGHLEGIAPPPN